MSRTSVALVVLLAISAPLAVADGRPATRPSIDALSYRWEDDRLLVSFRVRGGLSDEAAERLHSGIELELRHRIEVVGRRPLPLWPGKVLARARVHAEATYDPLTRDYDLGRSVERKTRKSDGLGPIPPEARSRTDTLGQVDLWLGSVVDVPVATRAMLGERTRLRIRVESVLGRRYVALIFPTTISATAEIELEP